MLVFDVAVVGDGSDRFRRRRYRRRRQRRRTTAREARVEGKAVQINFEEECYLALKWTKMSWVGWMSGCQL